MNRHARIIATVRHQPVGQLPIDLGGNLHSGIFAFAFDRLHRRPNLPHVDVDKSSSSFDTYLIPAESLPKPWAIYCSTSPAATNPCAPPCLTSRPPRRSISSGRYSIPVRDHQPWGLVPRRPAPRLP